MTGTRRSGPVAAALMVIAGCAGIGSPPGHATTPVEAAGAADPLNATYHIQGEPIRLRDGRYEAEAAPGAASRRIVRVIGAPLAGDLDGNGRTDYVLILVDDAGGSGTFYYLSAALAGANGLRGTNAMLIGDRIGLRDVAMGDGVVTVRYLARKPAEAMAASPSVPREARFGLRGARLETVAERGSTGPASRGWVVIGHEVRTFSPCSGTTELWLLGESEVQKAIARAYAEGAKGKRPYLPVLMELSGEIRDRPADGFGAQYDGAFLATGLVGARPGEICLGDRVALSKPAAGDVVRSPLAVEGRARGSWFKDGLLSIALLDAGGKVLARSHAVATGNRGKGETMEFKGMLEFTRHGNASATLVIMEMSPNKEPGDLETSRVPVVLR